MLGPHRRNSFSYKAINPIIKDILDERSTLDNTVQVAMPFIKVTSTIDLGKIAEYDIENINNYGFTLGIHAIDKDIEYEDMYSNRSGEYLIGYTYLPDGSTKKIYTPDITSINKGAINILDRGSTLVTDTRFSFIPPPGITSATIGRNRNGVISIAEIKISVPTLAQLEALHRTFLIPGVGMIVEWGQQFAPKERKSFGENGIDSTTVEENMFPWYDRDALNAILPRLALNQIGLEEILENYVYPTQGQYQWMYGKVANFSINANSDGSFDCGVKIVGPSEDSFAYSTRNTVVPPKLIRNGQPIICLDKSNSVESYFTKTVEGKNLKTLLEAMIETPPPGLQNWKGHVIKFDKFTGPFSGLERWWAGVGSSNDKQVSEEGFGDSEDSYFMTWRFFVNIVINDEEYGLKSIFKDALFTDDELKKVSILRPYGVSNSSESPRLYARPEADFRVTDPYENFVGNNKFLRSIDPSVLIIVNEAAAKEAEKELSRLSVRNTATTESDDSEKILKLGDFYESTSRVTDPTPSNGGVNDRGFLSTGVWINHKAVVQSMAPSQTILGGISNLLQRMNSATSGFWGLAIDPSEPESGDELQFNYGIVDTNYKESSEYAVNEFLDNVHVFNKYIRKENGIVLGSEVIESNIDLNLPKLLFSQIATIGLHHPSDMTAITDVDGTESAPDHPKVPDAGEQLRKMFSITSLAPTGEFDRGPDLTQLSKAEREILIEGSTCGEANSQTTAGTSGRGQATSGTDARNMVSGNSSEDRLKDGNAQLEIINKKIQFCNQYCIPSPDESVPAAPIIEPESQLVNRVLTQLTIGEIRRKQAYRHLFAVGKYQLIPDTLNEAIAAIGLSNGNIFSPQVQERLGDYLFVVKRRTLGRYLQGQDVSLFDAQLQLAQEFASMPVPAGRNVPLSRSRSVDVVLPTDSISFYSGDAAGNTSKASAATVAEILQRTRESGDLSIIKNFVSNFESSRDGYNAANVIPVKGGRFYSLFVGTPEYLRAMNDLPPIIGVGSTNSATPSILYSNRIIDINDVPRDQWPFESDLENTRLENKFNCNTCAGLENTKRILEIQISEEERRRDATNAIDKLTSEFSEFENVFRYIEPLPDWMVTQITNSGDDIFSNAFGASPGTLSISGDLVLPGINGLRVGELFWIDRIPSFYRAFGAFQVMSLEDSIGRDGWTTKIHARFNYLGGAWTKATSNLLSGNPTPTEITAEDINRVDTI